MDGWWHRPESELLQSLSSSREGLTQEEAERRLHAYGRNVFVERRKETIFSRFVHKLTNPLILMLLAAAVISGALGQMSDCIVITVILFISMTLDVYQEHQAVEGAEKLRRRVSLTASVLRDSVSRELPMSRLVPGDVITLSVGDIVPADCRLLSVTDLLVDQSTLTGESYPQEKDEHVVPKQDAVVSDRANCVFMGTHVVSGVGTALVVVTGNRTELGQVANSLMKPRPPTEFEKGITQFGMLLARTALIVAGLVFLSHIFLRHDILSSLLFVLALAIGFAPELLPVILTINLSKGAMRMSQKNVIVKSLPAIENFGSIEILATDKTGTLTENAIKLSDSLNISGQTDASVYRLAYLNSRYQTGYKGPMEDALLAHKPADIAGYQYVKTLPFDFFRKRVSVVFDHGKKKLLIIKGAPEELLKLSAISPKELESAKRTFERLSREGLRLLAVAVREFPMTAAVSSRDETRLTFLGFLAFTDPPKTTAVESLRLLAEAGVEIKILTGDNELVTKKICDDLNLPVKGILRGEETERLTEHELGRRAVATTIFARLNPDQKERVLKALRHEGKVVGYLGDGINDAPSLRESDIGISVNNAADVAKESADIILLHKSLRVLYDGVMEGRQTFGNVMKYLNMSMSSNFGNMLSVAVASLFLPFLPMLPIQILLNDLFYDFSQLLVANDCVDESYLQTPRRWRIRSIKRFMLFFGPVSSLFDFVTFGFLLWYFRANADVFQTGWFMESIVTQTLIVLSIRTQFVPFIKSKMNPIFAAGLFGIVGVSLLLPYTPFGSLFRFVRLPFTFFAILFGILAAYMFIVELLKLWFYRGNEKALH